MIFFAFCIFFTFIETGNLIASGSDDLKIVVFNWINKQKFVQFDSGHRSNVFQVDSGAAFQLDSPGFLLSYLASSFSFPRLPTLPFTQDMMTIAGQGLEALMLSSEKTHIFHHIGGSLQSL